MSPSTSTWKVGRVDSVAEYVTVGFVGSQAAHHVDSGIPLLRGQNVRPYRIDMSNLKYINDVTHEKWSKSALSAGDVVIVRVGYPGTAAVIPEGLGDLNAASLVIVRPDQTRLSADYFVSVLNSPWGKAMVESRFVGSAQQVLNAGAVAALEIPLPDIQVQRQIASILHAYDELIDNNSRRIEILEEMAQAIYREWFVEFRYPGHEEVPLVDSELCPIPEGWTVRRLGECVAAEKGLSYKGEFLTDEGTPMANLKCFDRTGGFRRSGSKPYSGPFKVQHSIVPGDLIVANTDLTQAGTVIGSPALVPHRGFEEGGLISHHLFAVRFSASSVDKHYLYRALQNERFRSYARGCASGTTVLGFRASDFLSFPLVVPGLEVQAAFSSIVSDLYSLSERLSELSENLSETRDLLLPRLISGEIDVSGLDIESADSSV